MESTIEYQSKSLSHFKKISLIFSSLLLFLTAPLQAEEKDNNAQELKIAGLIFAHNAALPTSLTPFSPASDIASVITFASNLTLKYTAPVFVEPGDKFLDPNTNDMCYHKLTLPQTEDNYSNVLGFWDIDPLADDWGSLGFPSIQHANTAATVKVKSSSIAGVGGNSQIAYLDAGTHSFDWSATSQVNPLFDIYLPAALFTFNQIKWGKLFTKIGNTGEKATKIAKTLDANSFKLLFNIAANLGIATGGQATSGKLTKFSNDRNQRVTVYDLRIPQIDTDTPVFEAEATDIGGAFYTRFEKKLLKTIEAFDPCGREYTLTNDAPNLLPLGETTVTWTIRDRGPNRNMTSNTNTLEQRIVVEDTQAPILVAPPGKVIETSQLSLSVNDIDFGAPRVVDLADATVTVDSDAPLDFERDSRTTVTWTATDDSGNSSMATQLVTLKEVGTNTAPTAFPASATTLTSKPVDIVLRGSDSDIIDGVADPLAFDIQSFPDNGEFISPLLPFFINDYRTTPEGPWGDEFYTSSNRNNWVGENICVSENTVLPDDFVYAPQFFQVTDDGTAYITDYYWECDFSDKSSAERRISKWDSEGNFLGSHQLSDNRFDEFVLDRDGKLYLISTVGAGSSKDLFLTRCSTDFGARSGGEICDNSWKFNYASAPGIDNRNFVYARVDSSEGIAYVSDTRNLYLFDIRVPPSQSAEYLGKLYDGFDMFECNSKEMRIDIDSEGNVYANNPCADRIYKFERSYFDSQDNIVLGELVGWMGKCDSSTNKACDADTGSTKGFSCTDQTCSVSVTEGSGPGQFNRPSHIVLDPNDILYVADRGNARIQRFGLDGTFAGEAKSTGTGINKGDSPSFILGNFAPPSVVTVNSKQFYILDEDESFVHVFETSPLKDITPSSATVTYVSEFSYHSGTDQFTYLVSDGLDESEEVTVSVRVDRNFRQPEAIGQEISLNEDSVIEFDLLGDDPDGILGKDFNGLDTLTYKLLSGPEHGRLEGTGESRRYTPDPDYHGPDNFVFVTNDGVEDSEPAVVDIEVLPVNDPPKLQITMPDKIGIGFPAKLSIDFTDDNPHPELETQHQVRVEWGDGSVDVNGEVTEDSLDGVVVISPEIEGVPGIAIAEYTYKFPDQLTVRACITDADGAQGCDTETISIEELIHTKITPDQNKEAVAAGEKVLYTITIENLVPESPMAGLIAENTNASIVLPDGMSVERVSIGNDCSINSPEVYCELGDMESGQKEVITVEGINDGTMLFEQDSELSVVVESSTPGLQKFFASLMVTTLTGDPTDSDGDGITDQYEIAMGLDPLVDDSSKDLDKDGLSNLEEFERFLLANSKDTDMDGIDDSWELKYGLDPNNLLDAGIDNDEDGFSNIQEYLAGRDPNFDEQTGTTLINTLAEFDDESGVLYIPSLKIGNNYFDVELEVASKGPLEFELAGYSPRKIRVDVENPNDFNLQTAIVDIPTLEYRGNQYNIGLRLSDDSPIKFKLSSVAPK